MIDILAEAEKIASKVLMADTAHVFSLNFKIPPFHEDVFFEEIETLTNKITSWWEASDDGESFEGFESEHKKKSP